jgi:hypothetical protein
VTIRATGAQTQLLVKQGPDELMIARLGPSSWAHRDALPRMMEGLALWFQCHVRVVLCVASALPLAALSVGTQYLDDPLKTKTPRVVPVHPTLTRVLAAWRQSGFQSFFGRSPSADDFIVPSRTGSCRARGTTLRNLQEDCAATAVTARRTHDTRHTFISLARRDGARKEVLERVTHNSCGDIVDHYTQFDWEPLCEAVACLRLSLDDEDQR